MATNPGTAPLESLDPRAKLTAAFASALCFSLVGQVSTAFVCLALALLLCLFAGVSFPRLFKRFCLVNLFIVFLWVTVPLTLQGDPFFSFGPFSFSRQGLLLCLLVTAKANAIFFAFTAFMGGMPVPLMGSAMERLRVPAKLVFLFLFTYRYTHVIGEEWQRLRTAAKLRGFVPGTNLHTYRTIANMLGLVFINSYDRSHRVYEAMLLRGFTGSFRTVTPLAARRRDGVFLALFLTALCALAAADLYLAPDALYSTVALLARNVYGL